MIVAMEIENSISLIDSIKRENLEFLEACVAGIKLISIYA
jgi:hypothetical protein